MFDVDPMTRSKLEGGTLCQINPMAIMGIIKAAKAATAAGVGIAQGAAENRASKPARERNESQLEGLLAQEEAGTLGLDPQEAEDLRSTLVTPIQQAAAESRQRTEQFGAASAAQGFGPAQLAELRAAQAREVGRASQSAGLQVRAADVAAEQQQTNEIEQRIALAEAFKKDKQAAIYGPIAQAFASEGASAADFQAGGNVAALGGEASVDEAAAGGEELSAAEQDELMGIFNNMSPEQQMQILSLIGGG